MSSTSDKRDVTVDLPEEMLCHVFSFLTLSEKLRSEAVNFKFQRCVIKELKAKPQPLDLDLRMNYNYINGYDVPLDRVFDALQSLAKKSKFSHISVDISCCVAATERLELLDGVLSVLSSENQCLTKVTSFRIDAGCSQLESFLNKCDKLSTICFPFNICPLNASTPNGYVVFPLDLCQLFNNNRLTELELRIFGYNQKCLVDLFRGIEPNSLRKVDLHLLEMTGLNVAELVNAMKSNAGSTLEEMRLDLDVGVQLAQLFDALARLPALQKCHILYWLKESANQFVPAVTSLLKMSHVNITLRDSRFPQLPACQIVTMIHQIQRVHPGLVVDFIHGELGLSLSLGNARVEKWLFNDDVAHCGTEDCARCQSFYPNLLRFLASRAQEAALNLVEAQHLPHWQIDRCRAGLILGYLDAIDPDDWRALSIEAIQDQQAMTINFEATTEHQHSFSITIGCGRCLSNGCVKCLI